VNVLTRTFYDKDVQGKIFDIAGPEVITYQGLIAKAAAKIRKTTTLFTLNVIPLGISRLWVSLITGIPKDLVYPLVLSLKHEMLPSPSHKWPYQEDLSTSLDQTLTIALDISDKRPYRVYRPPEKDVRSIQRLVLPPGRNAEWVAGEYFKWLPFFFSTLVSVFISEKRCTFYILNPSLPILILEKSDERSTPDRQLLYVVGGLLSGVMDRGRLEFREVLDRKYVMAALHEFRPALPWYIYRWTQAVVHILVMKAFGEHLKWHVISTKKVNV
jgi:hypothetical protein